MAFWDNDPLSAVDPNAQFGPPARPGEVRINIGGNKGKDEGPSNFWESDPVASDAASPLLHEAGRQLGLTGRATITGLTSIPTVFGDAANAAINLGSMGLNKATGSDIPMLRMPSEEIQSGMTAMGVPTASGILERLAQVGGSALSGAGGMSGLAKLAQFIPEAVSSSGNVLQSLPKLLGDQPIAQMIGALAGTGATETAQKMGVTNPLALMALGTLGGTMGGGAGTVGLRTGAGLKQAGSAFTQGGKDVLAGRVLNKISTNPGSAMSNLDSVREIVPGSAPMVSQVGRDAGLAGGENPMRGLDPTNRIGERYSQQNAARQAELNRIARDEETLDYATKKRDRAYEQFAVPAFRSKSPVGVDPRPLLTKINDMLASRVGVRKDVQDALGFAKERLENLINEPGRDWTDPETLYEVRKDIAMARDGKYNSDKSNLALAKKELGEVINSIDDTIESGAPGYNQYRKIYAKRSIPLDQLKAIQEIRSRAVLAASDPVSHQPILSNAKFQTLLRNNMDRGLNLRGKGPDAAKLSPNQLATLDRVASDLDRGAAATAGTVKVPGSDTFKNMSVASVIGRVLGDMAGGKVADLGAVKAIASSKASPLMWMFHIPDEAVQQLVLEAWLDPKLASRLMQKANDQNIAEISDILKDRAGRQAAAASLYAAE